MKKTIEKAIGKTIAKEKAKKLLNEKQAGKSQAKEILQAKKLLKKDFENLQKQKQAKEILQAKENLKASKLKKEGKQIEKKSKLENFGLFKNENYLQSQFAFNEKDFFIHGIEILQSEKEKEILHIYNKIESIGKGMNLNEIEKIILENLKKRILFEFIENFEKNLKAKNKINIKNLNLFFANSNLKKYIANSKEKENLNIFENEIENIFGKTSNNFESNYIEKINGKYILHFIGKNEKEKAKASLKEKRNGKKLNGIERKAYLKSKNKLESLKKELKAKEILKSEYNLKSKQIENSMKENPYLLKASKSIERMKRKVFEKNGIALNESKLKKELKEVENKLKAIELNEIEIEGKENKKLLNKYENLKSQLKLIEKKKKSIEKKIFGIYEKQIEKITLHGMNAKEKIYGKHIEKIKSKNAKIQYYKNYFENEYGKLLNA